MIHQSLPGIRRLYTMPCSALPRYAMLTAICGGVVVLSPSSLTLINFSGTPLLTWERTFNAGARQEKATLTFRTDADIPEGFRIAFVVECVNGKQYLLGKYEPNYPVIEYSESSGEITGNPAVRTYTVTVTDIKAVLPAIV